MGKKFPGVIQSPMQQRHNYIETQLQECATSSKRMSSQDGLHILL